tara:strand:+ start:2126 stop:2284 length:159 start_codon:yes stop_codon:yes gene_type:complete
MMITEIISFIGGLLVGLYVAYQIKYKLDTEMNKVKRDLKMYKDFFKKKYDDD